MMMLLPSFSLARTRPSRVGVLFLLVWLSICCSFLRGNEVPTIEGSKEGWKDEILKLQLELATVDTAGSGASSESLVSAIRAKLAESVEQESDWMRKQFREIPRPNERLDNENVPNRDLRPGMPLWFLLEIPQWWVTAKIVEILNVSEGHFRVNITAEDRVVQATRGETVRTVAINEFILGIWKSEYERDLGELARAQNKPEERFKHYQEAIKLDPKNPHPLDNMGLYYTDQGDVQQAIHWYEQSIQVQPNWYHTYYNYGNLLRDSYETAKQYTQWTALQLFEKAFKLNPLFLDTLWNVADQYHKAQRYNEECYAWRLLHTLNRNPHPKRKKNNTILWNPHWEQDLPRRIANCMQAMVMPNPTGTTDGNQQRQTTDEL